MNSAFKTLLQMDRQIFLNPDEFGGLHNVGGKEILILIDDNEMIEREKRQTGMEAHRQGIYKKQLLFYVKAEEFGKLPAVGRALILDGKRYTITDAVDENGIYSISLEAVQS